jgi:hypothetical protein
METNAEKAHVTQLKEWYACQEGIEFAEQFNSIQEAWGQCKNYLWMLWLLDKKTDAAYAVAYAAAAADATDAAYAVAADAADAAADAADAAYAADATTDAIRKVIPVFQF